ncbi:MAG: nitrile hydratase accessory protein [Acidimicrobiales bacterium]
MTTLPVDLDIGGTAAPPRSNGELVFSEPWESRIFGVTLSIHQAGYFEWPAFQAELISSIARWEDAREGGTHFGYYDCWLQAFESLLDRLNLVGPSQLGARIAEHRERPAGHDHAHDRGAGGDPRGPGCGRGPGDHPGPDGGPALVGA